jgi:hypothetical protein
MKALLVVRPRKVVILWELRLKSSKQRGCVVQEKSKSPGLWARGSFFYIYLHYSSLKVSNRRFWELYFSSGSETGMKSAELGARMVAVVCLGRRRRRRVDGPS